MGRVQKSIRNIVFAVILQLINAVSSFALRTVMIMVLGIESVSINGLFTEVVSALSLAELGVGSAIVFSLYKPLAEGNHEKVSELMGLFRKAYLIIALVTFVVGVSICPWIQYLIKDIDMDLWYIRIIYLLFVIQCSSSYLFSYKSALLNADQKVYLISWISAIIRFIGTIVCIVFLFLTKNYIVYLAIHISITIITNIVVSIKVDKLYPYISKKSKLPKEEQKVIFGNIKNIFFKQLAGKVVYSTDNILISTLVSTVLVGVYGNYNTVLALLKSFSDQITGGVTASIGNLFVSEDKNKCEQTLNRLTYIYYWVASIFSVGFFACIQSFISVWLGDKYLLGISIVLILTINMFCYIVGNPISTCMHMSGFFKIGKSISIVSAVVNLIVSIILGLKFGIVGIFIGTLCTYLIEITSKTFFLYKKYLLKNPINYYLHWLKMVILMAGMLGLMYFLNIIIIINNQLIKFLILGLISIAVVASVNIAATFKTEEFKYLINLMKTFIKRKSKGNNE